MKPKKTSLRPPEGWPSQKDWDTIKSKKHDAYQVLSSKASPVDRLKYKLCEEFVRYHNEYNLTQRQLAKKLGIGEARVSEIVHYKFQRFTIDKLIELLSILRPNLKIKVA